MDQYLPQSLSWSIHHVFDALTQHLYPYAEQTVLVPDLVETMEWKKSHVFLASMLACYPLGLMMQFLPYGTIRHVFSLVTGALLLQVCWGPHWIHTPLTSFLAYGLIRWCSSSSSSSSSIIMMLPVQKVVPVFVMAYLALAHFQHQFFATNYMGMDIHFTCSQMILTQKLYMLAYNLHDGYLLAKGSSISTNKDDDNKNTNTTKNDNGAWKAAKSCSEFALTKCPSLLEYLGYCFCFSTVLVGPSFEFSHYKSACDGSLHYTTITHKDGTQSKQLRGTAIPSNILPTLGPLLKSFMFIVFSSIFDKACNYRRLTSPWFFHLTTRQRLFYNWLTNFIQRQKVYFTWLFAEGANNIWYAGFDGYDETTGEAKGWTIARGADIWRLETCSSIKCGTKAWNKKTSLWLLRYVYIRNKSRLGIVYTVSAIWHGFYPGYYMLASVIWLISQCERLGRKKISPYFSDKRWSCYDICVMVGLHALGSYATTAFFLRSWENVMDNWRSHHFWGHIALLVFYVLVSLLPTPASKLQQRPAVKSAENAVKPIGELEPVPSLATENAGGNGNEYCKLETKLS